MGSDFEEPRREPTLNVSKFRSFAKAPSMRQNLHQHQSVTLFPPNLARCQNPQSFSCSVVSSKCLFACSGPTESTGQVELKADCDPGIQDIQPEFGHWETRSRWRSSSSLPTSVKICKPCLQPGCRFLGPCDVCFSVPGVLV